MTPSIKHLRAFLHVAESGSFIAGALRSNMSQPSLSRTIRILEAELGTRLFDRDTRGTVLTPAGRELVTVANRIVSQTQAEIAKFNRYLVGDQRRITLAALPSLSSLLLPQAIAAFSKTFPQIEFSLREANAEDIETAILSGAAELGLSVKPAGEELFDWRPLLTDQFGIVVRHDDPLAEASSVSWHVLHNRPFVSHVTSTSACKYLTAALMSAGVHVTPAISCSEIASAGKFVEYGMGIALLPQLCIPLLSCQPGTLVWRPLTQPVSTRRLAILMAPQAAKTDTDSNGEPRTGAAAASHLGQHRVNVRSSGTVNALDKFIDAILEAAAVVQASLQSN